MRFFLKEDEIREYQGLWENYVRLTASNSTSVRYSKSLDAFFSRFPDKKKFVDFTRRDIEDYRLIRLRQGINPNTLNYDLTILAQFFKWAMEMDKISWNPATQVKRLRFREPKRESLNIADQLELWKGCFEWGDRALVALALSTALRGETLAELEKSEVDFENARLMIPADKMKTGRSHEIPLPSWVVDILRDAPEGRIFGGYAKNVASLRYYWNKICKRAGVKLRGIRMARRTVATTLLRSGVDLKIVQDLLGHRNIATTSRYLTPADNATMRDALDKIPKPTL